MYVTVVVVVTGKAKHTKDEGGADKAPVTVSPEVSVIGLGTCSVVGVGIFIVSTSIEWLKQRNLI